MIINYISMRNFQCFYGPHESNTVTFSDGINIIIGDNGHGKSKLWNAFYWALYDEIFDSDRERFVTTRQSGESIFSDRAKKECAVEEFVKAEIKLEVVDSQGDRFEIYRMLKAKKLDDRNWEPAPSSTLLIRRYKVTQWQTVDASDYRSILERVLPGHLKPYMWFQGEQVNSLMDFQNQTSLTQAIQLLSDITNYDDLVEITRDGKEKSAKALSIEQRRLSSDSSKSEDIEFKVTKKQKELEEEERDKEFNTKNKEEAEIGFDALINSISEAESRAENKASLDSLTKKRNTNEQQLDSKIQALNKKLFSSHWVLKGCEPSIADFSDKYTEFLEYHYQKAALDKIAESELPVNVPQPIFVNKMLAKEACFVCGHLAPKGSDEYKHISGLLDRKIQSSTTFKNDCSSLFKKLYDNTTEYKNVISGIDLSISKEFSSITKLRNEISSDDKSIEAITKTFGELVEKDQSENIVKEFRRHKKNLENYKDAIHVNKTNIDRINDELEVLKKQTEKLVVGSPNKAVEAAAEIFNKLSILALSTRSLVFSNLVKDLEESANDIYQSMAERNRSVIGRLNLRIMDSKTCFPEIVDGDGNSLAGSNDSNIRLVKLALMMAVLKSRSTWSQNYCLVSDAPTSKMSRNYSEGFYEALGKNFRQSIVITFDFVTETKKSDIKINNLGKVYKLNSVIPDGDRTKRDDLYTEIKELDL